MDLAPQESTSHQKEKKNKGLFSLNKKDSQEKEGKNKQEKSSGKEKNTSSKNQKKSQNKSTKKKK